VNIGCNLVTAVYKIFIISEPDEPLTGRSFVLRYFLCVLFRGLWVYPYPRVYPYPTHTRGLGTGPVGF